MSISLDFSSVPTTEVIPAGDYMVMVENVTLKDSKNVDEETGVPSQYLNWQFAITEGTYQGRILFDITSLKLKALWKLRKHLINLDAYEENMEIEDDPDSHQIISPELIGRVGVARVKMGSYNGQPKAEIDVILDVDGNDREKGMRKAKGGGDDAPSEGPATGATRRLDRPDRSRMSVR